MSSSYHAAWVQARLESTSVYVVGHHTLKGKSHSGHKEEEVWELSSCLLTEGVND